MKLPRQLRFHRNRLKHKSWLKRTPKKGKEMNDQSTIEQVPAPEAAIAAVVEGSKEGEVTVHVQTEAEVGAEGEASEPRVLM